MKWFLRLILAGFFGYIGFTLKLQKNDYYNLISSFMVCLNFSAISIGSLLGVRVAFIGKYGFSKYGLSRGAQVILSCIVCLLCCWISFNIAWMLSTVLFHRELLSLGFYAMFSANLRVFVCSVVSLLIGYFALTLND